jgi:hypothetical protein
MAYVSPEDVDFVPIDESLDAFQTAQIEDSCCSYVSACSSTCFPSKRYIGLSTDGKAFQ